MAKFEIAYHKTAIAEGGYSNDPDDSGGETWRGIARKKWPSWSGWTIVDQWKQQFSNKDTLTKALAGDETLQLHVLAFYKKHFWDEMRGDEITDQYIADNIYDDGVNTGISSGIRKAQRVLGLSETGKMDTITLNEINNMP